MAYESLKTLTAAPVAENGNASEPAPTKTRRGRRKKESDETAIAKSPGHELANKQRSESAEILQTLEEQERTLTAYLGYQEGQGSAKLRLAARTAGATDVLVAANLDRIDALKEALEQNLKTHNPLATLDELGLNRSEEETQELRQKAKDFNSDEFNRFLL